MRTIILGEVTYGDFADLAKRKGWTLDFLAEKFRGQIDPTEPAGLRPLTPRDYFGAMLRGRHSGMTLGNAARKSEPFNVNIRENVIALRAVLRFYYQERGQIPTFTKATQRLCACGCYLPVYDRKKFATMACKQRAFRERSVTSENGQNNPDVFSVET